MRYLGDSPFDPPGFGNMGGKKRRPREVTEADLLRRQMYEHPPADAVIDAIRPSGRQGVLWRVSVQSESEGIELLSVARLDRGVVDELHLSVGRVWTPALASAVLEAAHRSEARRYAINALAMRAMSAQRLREKIEDRGAPKEIAAQVVADLERSGLIDDRVMAEQIGRSALRSNPVGARVLEARLRRRGIAPQIARQLTEPRDEVADAVRVGTKKLRILSAKLERPVAERRLMASLARRGFSPDVCRTVSRRLLAEREADAPTHE
ncbi:MAG: regulatory protein RecX [Phycisphaerales bacterium JB050]